MTCSICEKKEGWFIDENTCMDCYDSIMEE